MLSVSCHIPVTPLKKRTAPISEMKKKLKAMGNPDRIMTMKLPMRSDRIKYHSKNVHL